MIVQPLPVIAPTTAIVSAFLVTDYGGCGSIVIGEASAQILALVPVTTPLPTALIQQTRIACLAVAMSASVHTVS